MHYRSASHALHCAFHGNEERSGMSNGTQSVQRLDLLGTFIQGEKSDPTSEYDSYTQNIWTLNLLNEHLSPRHRNILKAKHGKCKVSAGEVAKDLCEFIGYPTDKHLLLRNFVIRWCGIDRMTDKDIAEKHSVSPKTLWRLRNGTKTGCPINPRLQDWRNDAIMFFEDVLRDEGLL